MNSSFSFTMSTILVLLILVDLPAQDNREPPHTCFNLEQEREVHIPVIQDGDETNSFTCKFNVPGKWPDKQVFVRIPGMPVPYTIMINGFAFGSDPGTGTAAEFNITPFLRAEGNSLDLDLDLPTPKTGPVSSDPCEGVTLLIRDDLHVRDLLITSYPEAGNLETLVRFHLFIKSYLREKNKGSMISIEVTDPDGYLLTKDSRRLGAPLSFGQETEMVFDCVVKNSFPWSPKHPHLFRLEIQQSENGKNGNECIVASFGIRTVVLSDSVVVVSGDTLNLVTAPPELADSLSGLQETEIERLLEEKVFNSIRTDGSLPCHLLSLFENSGVLIIKRRDQASSPEGYPLLNSPSLIWAD